MQTICIVVPCYNEEKRLEVAEFTRFAGLNPNVDFLFVNDGSTDNTKRMLDELKLSQDDRFFVQHLEQNVGKAEAVRQGVRTACEMSYNRVGFWDADLATPLSEISLLLEQMDRKNATVAIASRVKRLGVKVERNASRHYFGRVFSTLASMLLRLPVYDTQCGAKIFNADLQVLFAEPFSTRWLFDVELLARFRNHFGVAETLSKVIEVPVQQWIERGGSKLRFRHLLRIPFDLLKIHIKYN
jgi:dolichyl-phosphate beta-glucosyltransferase